MKLFFVSLFLGGISNVFAQSVCSCNETTPKGHQDRSNAKHATNFGSFNVKGKSITPETMYAWEDSYAAKTKNITTKPNSARVPNTPEDTLYVLRGYLWMVKIENNDCDFHMEIGPLDKSMTRMIVEIPKENKAMQEKVKRYLDSLKLTIKGCPNLTDSHFNTGIPIIVTGLGFYDASHKPNTNHGDEHTLKYSWELHPIKSVIFP